MVGWCAKLKINFNIESQRQESKRVCRSAACIYNKLILSQIRSQIAPTLFHSKPCLISTSSSISLESLSPVKVGMVEEGGCNGGAALSDAGMEIAHAGQQKEMAEEKN